ncbi:MAG: hypothetical protein LH473_01795, partial [Chitinophagales bacterium]|nr:hypothetical protein [Chitinophagales bacterium]
MKNLIHFLKLTILFSALSICHPVKAQNYFTRMLNPPGSFYDIKTHMDQLYIDKPLLDNDEGNSQNQYRRWINLWDTRVGNYNGQAGSFRMATDAMLHFKLSQTELCTNSTLFNGDWHLLGPDGDDLIHQDLGLVTSIWVDPSNSSNILIAGSSGGLWKTIDNGLIWSCITDGPDGLPAVGIEAIAVDPNNANNIFIATGSGNQNAYPYGIGICYSNDGGATWEVDEDFLNTFFSGYQIPYINNLKFAPGTSDLYATSGNKVYHKNINSGYWADLLIPCSISSDPAYASSFIVSDLEFNPSNSNYIYCTGIDGSNLYSGGAQMWRYDGIHWWQITPSVSTVPESVLNSQFSLSNLTLQNWKTDPSGKWVIGTLDASNAAMTNQMLPLAIAKLTQCKDNKTCGDDYALWVSGGRYQFSFKYSVPPKTKVTFYLNNTENPHDLDTNYPYYPSYQIQSIDNLAGGTTLSGTYTSSVFSLPHPSNPDFLDSYYYDQIVFEAVAALSYNYATDGNLYIDNVSVKNSGAAIMNVSVPTSTDLFALVNTGANYVLHSTDNGTTWVDEGLAGIVTDNGPCNTISSDGIGTNKFEFEVSPSNLDIMYIGGNIVYRSTDGGDNFYGKTCYNALWGSTDDSYTHADIRSLLIYQSSTSGNDDVIYIGTDGGLSKTSDGTTTWKNLNGNGLTLTQFYGFDAHDIDLNSIVGGSQDNGFTTKSNAGWSHTLTGDGYEIAFENGNSNIIFGEVWNQLGAPPKIQKSTAIDKGSSWTSTSATPANAGLKQDIITKPVTIHPQTGSLLIGYNQIAKSVNGGNIWTYQKMTDNDGNNIDEGYGTIKALDMAPDNEEKKYIAIRGTNTEQAERFFKYDLNIPATVDKTSNLPVTNQSITDVVSDPLNNNRVWVSMGNFPGPTIPNPGVSRIYYNDFSVDDIWEDRSAGLPDFPVNKITYYNGSDDILFAGTDVGMYVWNKTNGSWECFSEGLPACMVIDLEINYCGGKLRAATYGRGIWESDLPALHQYVSNAISPANGEVWNSNRNISTNIEIPANVTLTINNGAIISMAKNTFIKVDKGAKLIIDGATLTNSCGYLWSGIQVIGDPLQDQSYNTGTGYYNYQGWLVMKNGATIENAYVAAMADEASYTAPDYTYPNGTVKGGGIIQAENASFINCRKAIGFGSYHAPLLGNIEPVNKSFVKNCTFDCNGFLNPPYQTAYTSEFISAWNVH